MISPIEQFHHEDAESRLKWCKAHAKSCKDCDYTECEYNEKYLMKGGDNDDQGSGR